MSFTRWKIALCLWLWPALAFAEQALPSRLVFAMPPYLARDDLRREAEPLCAYLGKKLGIPVELRLAKTYEEAAHLLVTGQVDIADLSPFNYIHAKRIDTNISILAVLISEGGATAVTAYLLVREDSGITTVEQLRGKRFAFVDPHSSSGYLYPLAYLRSLRIDTNNFFSSVVFAGNHQALAEMLVRRDVDAGASTAAALNLFAASHPNSPRLKILAKAGRVPLGAYVARSKLHPQLVEKLRSTLLGLSTRTPEGRRVLTGWYNRNGFVAADDSHYDGVRELVAKAQLQ